MSVGIAEVPDEQVEDIVKEINRQGFASLPNFIDASGLAEMRLFVREAQRASHQESFALLGESAFTGSCLEELGNAASFRRLMTRIYARGTGFEPPEPNFHVVFRCLTGESAKKHSYAFHYDTHFLTALFPIEIPAEVAASGRNGDLLMFPNVRQTRKSYLLSFLDKGLLYVASRLVLSRLAKHGLLKTTRIKMVPGHAYFFWGYRSVHANEPCDAAAARATALFHYVDPHERGRKESHYVTGGS